jgi:hypothetical protein
MIVLQCRGKDIIGINMLVIRKCSILWLISFLVLPKTRERLADLIFTFAVALPDLSEVGQNEPDIVPFEVVAEGGSSRRDRTYCADVVNRSHARFANNFRSKITATIVHFHLLARTTDINTSRSRLS